MMATTEAKQATITARPRVNRSNADRCRELADDLCTAYGDLRMLGEMIACPDYKGNRVNNAAVGDRVFYVTIKQPLAEWYRPAVLTTANIAPEQCASYFTMDAFAGVSAQKAIAAQKPVRRYLPGERVTDLSPEAAAVIMHLAEHPVTPPRQPKAVPFGTNPRFLG